MLERVGGSALGYEPEQVDALLDRVRRQYENPKSRLMTSSMLSAVQFDLVPGGYRTDQIDDALAVVADEFEKRDISLRIERLGRREIAMELEQQLQTIATVLAQEAEKQFSPARGGYNKKLVRQLLLQLEVKDGRLSAPDTKMLRTMPLGRSSGGPSRAEVNEFLAMVIGVIYRQQLLG